MPALMSLEGPGSLGCMGCTRPTSQPGTNGVTLAGFGGRTLAPTAPCINCTPTTTILTGLSGASSSFGFITSPLALAIIGLGLGGFLAYRTMGRKRGLSGSRKRRRR
jgi:hypothetical protein